MRQPYDAKREHEAIGAYPAIKGLELGGEGVAFHGIPESSRLYRPIEPRENYKMLLLRGEKPLWMPQCGWMFCDVNEFRPRQHPDNLANHQCMDGGEAVDYASGPKVRSGWFDLPLEWEPLSVGASVRPGNPKIEDMNDWESLTFPNLDDINWDEMREINRDYLNVDKANQLGIQFGFWERMMCIMAVGNAAIALADPDQEDAIHTFLDKLADLYIDYIGRVMKIGRIDSVMLHDDWGTQNAPFFSLETARRFFVGPMKRVVDFCHANDIVFERHCCGNATALVPAMVEIGTDYWFPQQRINDLDYLIETYKDEHITFAVANPPLAPGFTPEQVREIAASYVGKYKDAGVLTTMSQSFGADSDPSLYPIFADAVYEFSRKAYQNG